MEFILNALESICADAMDEMHDICLQVGQILNPSAVNNIFQGPRASRSLKMPLLKSASYRLEVTVQVKGPAGVMSSKSRPMTNAAIIPHHIANLFRMKKQWLSWDWIHDYSYSAIVSIYTKSSKWKWTSSDQRMLRLPSIIHVHMDKTATAGSDVVQSGRPIFDDFFQHLWPYIGNNTANVVFQMVKRLWLVRIDQ
ncbi:hypothetical protein TNCV_1023691 [Trichonephila clavipes]|nr:hypothetical protein TNCV_1023691 [Trichonephila clavipes]